MDGRQLIEGLQGTKIRRILSSLMYATDMLQNDEIDRPLIDKLYHSLIPLLVHNHYKIRGYAFNILLQLLCDYDDSLSCPDIALASCILGLQCVNKSISDTASNCVKRILEISDINSIWVELDETIRAHRSTEVRLKVLEILIDFADQIPLQPILTLLDDPKAQIRMAAKAIIDAADPEAVRDAICSARLSYETTQELMRKYNLQMEDLVAPVSDHSSASYATKMRGRAAKCRRAVEDMKQGTAARSVASPSSSSVKRRGGDGSSESLESGSQARKRKPLVSSVALARAEQRKYLEELKQREEESLEFSERGRGFHSSAGPMRARANTGNTKERNPGTGRVEFTSETDYPRGRFESTRRRGQSMSDAFDPRRKKFGDDQESVSSSRARREDAEERTRGGRRREQSLPPQSEALERQRNRMSGEGEHRYNRLETPEVASETVGGRSGGRFSRSGKSSTRDKPGSMRESLESEVQAPLGKIIRPQRVSLPVQPRDLSKASWLEKISFLDMLKDCLAKNMRFKESPSQIIDCVLTASLTEHKRVTFLIPPILSELILRHPEVLRSYLNQIMTFTLNTMFHESSKTDADFNQFLSVLFVEADPTELIDKALKICDKTARKLPFERFVRKLYKARDDIVLPYNVLAHLVSLILKTPDCEKLLALICVYEFKSVQRFGSNQPEAVRQRLLPFMKAAHAKRQANKKSQVSIRTVDIGHDEKTWRKIVSDQLEMGGRADIPRLAAAMVALPIDDGVSDLFQKFLLFIAKIPLWMVLKYEDALVEICTHKFADPALLSFLEDEWIDAKLVTGLSRCIWDCPSTILEGSDAYLSPLYAMFRRSIGPTRIDLAQIFLAIFQKTHVSVLDLEEVLEPHRKLIDDLMAQYRIVQP